MSTTRIEADFRRLEEAAAAGLRCPFSDPFGPISTASIGALIEEGRIRSEVYRWNYRVVTILDGPHKGKRTAPPPFEGSPYLVNGVHVDRIARRQARIAP